MRLLLPILAGVAIIQAQSNGCQSGYSYGSDTVLFTLPYSYAQVMSVIGSYKNLTWSASPDGTVTLNGTDNTVGTSRTYDIAGAHVVETITNYSKPVEGPYFESHTLAPLEIPGVNLRAYSDYDATTVSTICDGRASTFNFTINFCANNITVGAGIFHELHLADAKTVGVFLGGREFTNCGALNGTSTTSSPLVTPTTSIGAASIAPMWMLVVVGFGIALYFV